MHAPASCGPVQRAHPIWSRFIKLAAGGAATTALAVGLATPAASEARIGPAAVAAPAAHSLAADTHFYAPPASVGAIKQIAQLLAGHQPASAALIGRMEAIPSAVWLDGETPAEAARGAIGEQQADLDTVRQITQALARAGKQNAVPIFVAYNIPGRDCSQYSAGGAPSDAAYRSWIDAIQSALGGAQAVLILEPDGLANLPGYCGAAYSQKFPEITNTTRIDDVAFGVSTLEQDPNISLYLDAGHSAWQAVGNIAEVLVAADVQQAQGFFLNVSNYQYAANNAFYGTWVSSCIAYATQLQGEDQTTALGYAGTLTAADNSPSGAFANCPNQYWNGGPANGYNGVAMSPYGVWSESQGIPALSTIGTDSNYASLLGSTVPTTHFVIDTSRDGLGPNAMQGYVGPPFDQPSSVTSALQGGNWCNPPGSGVGTRPTADTAAAVNSLDSYLPSNTSLLDAYLWVKPPGESDGQCDIAGGVRNWQDFTAAGVGGGYTPPISGWPTSTSSNWTTFDPLWSLQTGTVLTDPAAGAWFPQQALQLAQNADPGLN